jgi:hypothetical protein
MPFAFVFRLAIATIVCGGLSSVFAQTSSWGVATPHLVFSTYLGGGLPVCQGCAVRTFAQNAASDAWGNTYVTGGTTVSDLAASACQGKPAADRTLSAFVVKYDPYGRLLWCTYLGGNNQSMGVGVAVMPDGGVAIGGMTQSDRSQPFPTLNAFQSTYNGGGSDYFVSVFDAEGKLRYSTYLGGSELDGEVNPNGDFDDDSTNGNNIAVDANGLVYLTGVTASRGGPTPAIKFPVTWNAIQPDMRGDDGTTDAFLCILDPAKSGRASLLYCSFLGGKKNEKGHSVAVNANGSAIAVAGYTNSSDFPTTPNGYRSVPPDNGFTSNSFVAQFREAQYCPASVSCRYMMQYSTYLGGYLNNGGGGPRGDTYDLAIDSRGGIVATGRTADADFPMTPSGPSIYNSAPYLLPGTSNDQPYLVRIDPSLIGTASLTYSTFLGGGGFCTGVAVDPTGNAWVAGENSADGVQYTPSYHPVESPTLFPYTKNALIHSHLGAEGVIHATLMQIDRNGRSLSYSTYLGGTLNDRAYGLAVDRLGNVVVSGVTSSPDFPLKNPAQHWPTGSTQNAFVTKFSAY